VIGFSIFWAGVILFAVTGEWFWLVLPALIIVAWVSNP
jgi:hypothetical protein